MREGGIFDLSGVPGSGKTLTSVYFAKKHYKKENSALKRMVALFKYKIAKNSLFCAFRSYILKINIFSFYKKWCLSHNSKIYNYIKILLKVLFLLFKYFVYLFIILYWFVSKNLCLSFLFIFFMNRKNIYNWFDSLDYEYYSMFPYGRINNIYSSFPILLDKKYNIYSNKTSIWQWNNDFSFLPNSVLISDEIQLFIDSDEYSDKKLNKILKKISHFLQAHRHFAIKNIFLTAQHPDRVFKKAREICSGYIKLHKVIKFPFLPFGIIRGIIYYDLEHYGSFIPKDREERNKLPFDYRKFIKFANIKNIYSSYNSRYLARLNFSKPLSNNGTFDSLGSDFDDLKTIFKRPIVSDDFNDDIFDVGELKENNSNSFFNK